MVKESAFADDFIAHSIGSHFSSIGSQLNSTSGSTNERCTVTSKSLHGNLMRSITNRDPMK